MKKKKVYAPCLDVIGRQISWKPSNSDRLYGEVVEVWLVAEKDPNGYPHTRLLKKRIKVRLYDGRQLSMSGELDDLKAMGALAE